MSFRNVLSFFAVIMFACCIKVTAQVYPVQANVSIQPPYSPYLTDYIVPGSQKVLLQLRTNDITITDHPIKLRIIIEGLGITIRTKQNFIPQQHTLYGGGTPTILYGEDLQEYFHPNNLDFAGLSRTEFLKTGKLPEGVYKFSVEVFSYNRNVQLSNKAFTMAWIILNDPPLLNLPRKDAKVKVLDPTTIAFTWTPRHTASPNSAFSSEYIFRLVEIWPENRNPYDAFLSQPALYEETTAQTQLVYGLEHPALIPGRKYAWQVQAVDVDGKDLFKNQGRSEVYVFQFGDALSAPENIQQDGANATTINLSWDAPIQGAMPKTYRVRYRKKGTTDNSKWDEAITDQRWITLTSLQPETDYEIQLRSEAQPQLSEYSTRQFVQTEAETTLPYTCGKETAISAAENSSPLLMLSAGDAISASNFKVIVTEAEGNNGTFSGTGVMSVPFFNMANVKVAFSGIQVNDKYQLVVGEIITTYNPGSPLSRQIEEAHKIGEAKPATSNSQQSDSTEMQSMTYTVAGTIDSIFVNADGKIEVIDEHGNTTTYEPKKDENGKVMETIIVDSAGSKYTVDAEGKVTKEVATSTSSVASANGSNNLVNFRQMTDQLYGFDQMTYDVHADNYEEASLNGSKFRVTWKSVASGRTDKIIAWSDQQPNLFDSVNYQSPVGDILKREVENGVEITVTGTTHEEVSEVEAYFASAKDDEEKTAIGKINVISYDPIVRKLVLVPVNNAPIPSHISLSEKLSKIFSPAIVTWTVTEADNINVELGEGGKLDDGSSGLLSNYTSEMRDVIRKFKEDSNLEDETYYLFFVSAGESNDKTGYMPRKKQCGFIFTSKISPDNLPKIAAHELAHGAFRLEHTFETYPSLSKGSTENLMDYRTGTVLHKYQWDLIHNPVAVWGLFEDDEEGAYSLPCLGIFDECDDVLAMLENIRDGSLNASDILAKYPSDGKLRLEGLSVKVNNMDYKNITIIYGAEPNTEYYVKPRNYEDFKGEFFTSEGRIETQEGFVLKFGIKPIVKILIFEDDATFVMKRENLREYLFEGVVRDGISKAELEGMKVQAAIQEMSEYLGNDYKQESGELRTALTETGVEKMDCSEFVSRFLQKVTGVEEVPSYTTATMIGYLDEASDHFEHINYSEKSNFKNIRPGDIFVWRNSDGGHTGVVLAYNVTMDQVTIMEAIGSGGANEESLSKTLPGYCKGCIRTSLYTRTGKALAGHSGWKGYFRPKIKTE